MARAQLVTKLVRALTYNGFLMLVVLALCLAVLSLWCARNTPPVESRLSIAEGAEARARIVTPVDAPHPVRFAAEELRHFLDEMSGARFAITHTIPSEGAAIVLGEDLARSAGVDLDGIERDGYRLRTLGDHLFIAGHDDRSERSALLFELRNDSLSPDEAAEERARIVGEAAWDFERGTLHGVYAFLERLGVRWFFPGPQGMVVPARSELDVGPIDVVDNPFFELRVSGRVVSPHRRYLKRGLFDLAEFERLGWTERNQRLWAIRMRSSSTWMAFNHRPIRHQWRRRFTRSHPEYFALQKDGQRMARRRKQKVYLNYTSEGVFRETVADVEAFFSGARASTRGLKEHPLSEGNRGWNTQASYGDTFSLLPNDGLKVNYSEGSLSLLREDEPHPYRHTDYIWKFVDRVARTVQPNHPDKRLVCLAYQTYSEVPEVIDSLPDNVIVGIASLSGGSRMSNSVHEARYSEFLSLVEKWSRMTKNPLLFWHYSLYRHGHPSRKGLPMVLPRHGGRVIRDLSQYGRYLFMEHDLDNVVLEHINRYVYLRLMWNPQADVDELLEDYSSSFYGPAGPVMLELLNDIELRSMTVARGDLDPIAAWETVFTPGVLERYRRSISQAAALTKGTPHAQAVELMSDRFVGEMERSRDAILTDVEELRRLGADALEIGSCGPMEIQIDGELDEAAWQLAKRYTLYNNVNGSPTRPEASVQSLAAADMLFCAFDIGEETAEGHESHLRANDSVEIFLDPNGDRSSYYWVQVKRDGAVEDRHYPSGQEPPDISWESRCKSAVREQPGRWFVEVAIPLHRLGATLGSSSRFTGNFALTRITTSERVDRFSTTNPLLRGRFHRPGSFSKIRFVPSDSD